MGIFTGAASVIIKISLNILLIPILLRAVGIDQYSLYVLLLSVLELFLLMDLGFNSALIRILGANPSAGESPKARQVVTTGHWLYVGLTLLAALLGALLLPAFPKVFNLTDILVPVSHTCLLLVFVEALLTLYTFYYRSVLYAHSQHQWVNLGDSVFSIAGNVLGLLLILSGFGLPSLFVARLLAAVLRTVMLVQPAYRAEPGIFQLKGKMELQTLREIFSLSFHAAMVNLSVQISHKIDSFVIALFLPLSAVGVFEIVFRILSVTLQIGLKISEGVFPLFSRMAALSQKAEARQLFLRMSCFTNFVASLSLLLIVCFYPQLFQLVSDGKVPRSETIPVLLVAVPIIWTGSVQMPAGPYLFASGRQNFLTVSSLLAAFSNLVLSLILVQHVGLVGVALGTLIPQLIQHQGSLIREVCIDLGISFWQYIREVHLKVLPGLAAAGAWTLLMKSFFSWEGASFVPMMLITLSAIALGSVLWLWLWALPGEVARYRDKLLRKVVREKTQV